MRIEFGTALGCGMQNDSSSKKARLNYVDHVDVLVIIFTGVFLAAAANIWPAVFCAGLLGTRTAVSSRSSPMVR